MNRTAFKIAASTAMVALTMTSVAAPSGAVRRFGERANGPTDRQARQFYEQAGQALQQGHVAEAVTLMLFANLSDFLNDGVIPHSHTPINSSGAQITGSSYPSSLQIRLIDLRD